MQKLTPEQTQALPRKYKGNLSPVYVNILNLLPGENLHIETSDWKRKYPISRIIRKIQEKHNRQYTLTHLAANHGWIISRLK